MFLAIATQQTNAVEQEAIPLFDHESNSLIDRLVKSTWGPIASEQPSRELNETRNRIPSIQTTSSWENLRLRVDVPSAPVGAHLPTGTQRTAYIQPIQTELPQQPQAADANDSDNDIAETEPSKPATKPIPDGDGSSPKTKSANRLDQSPDPATQRYDSMSFDSLPMQNAACIDANPIDLPTTLRLAGASNLQVAIARERICEASANLKMAHAMWLPSLNLGVGYNNHNGRIQATDGQVVEAARSSFFVGGGAVMSSMPLAGGSGGPLRMGVDLSLADALYEPLAAQQRVEATNAAHSSTFNDVLMQAAVGYLDLVRGQGQRSIAAASIKNAQELLRLTEAQQDADVGLPADVQRSRAELALRELQLYAADEQIGVASARLSRLLHLDACCKLCAQDNRPLPISLVDPATPLCDLVGQAIAARPERCEALAVREETTFRKEQEFYRPFLPNLHLGYSAGGFGGSGSSSIDNFGSRGDLDFLAVWQVRNLGVGTHASRQQANSRHRQACLAESNVRDRIGAEVSAAYYQVQSRLQQIEVTRQRVEAAGSALPMNFRGIVGRQLRAIEAQQAIQALDTAWQQHLDAIIRYNQGQFMLLRAVGKPATVNQTVPTPVAAPMVNSSMPMESIVSDDVPAEEFIPVE